MTIRMPKLLKASRDRSCKRCGANDGTVVACHYTGPHQLTIAGKGTGHKGHDHIRASLCMRCHAYFDQYQYIGDMTADEAAMDFLGYCLREITDDLKEGLLK